MSENLSVSVDDVDGVLLEKLHESEIKLTVSLDCVSIVLDSLDKFALLDVHRFHAITVLFLLKLIIHDLLEAHSFEAEHVLEALKVALVGHDVVGAQTLVVKVELVEDHVTWSTHLQGEVHGNILITKMAAKQSK